MKSLHIDIETYSSEDLAESGAYRYAEAEDFEILLFAYAYGEEVIRIVDLMDPFDALPESVLRDLENPEVLKIAHNAAFERICIQKHFGRKLDPSQWRCTSVLARSLGLPGSLEQSAAALHLTQQKDRAGKALIGFFSKPCKPTKANGMRTRNLPEHDPNKWESFKRYCVQDVEVERAIDHKLVLDSIPEKEWKLYALDQRINDTGIRIDQTLARNAVAYSARFRERITEEMKDLTGLENPNSVAQLKEWMDSYGVDASAGIGKDKIEDLRAGAPEEVQCALDLRQQISKSSTQKFDAMLACVCRDERAHGAFQFMGAGRTGRWAGRLFQPHNLPQTRLSDLDTSRQIVRCGDPEIIDMLFDQPMHVLSNLVRTALIPADGHRFLVVDFSAIEARVVAWLAGERWVLDVFRSHGKIYEATAAAMFHIPIEKIVKGQPEYEYRAKGKVATLACGYQGGVSALIAMGALKSGIPEDELPGIIGRWRKANPNIVSLWSDLENGVKTVLRGKRPVKIGRGVTIRFSRGMLFIDLPSGRSLSYPGARLGQSKKIPGKEAIEFRSQVGATWGWEQTYGGKLTENIVQAIARDCLAECMLRLENRGYHIIMHVHDEIICEEPVGKGDLGEVIRILSEPIEWAPELPLTADGFECTYYKKD
ncbi:MAG: DNA polymerase [Bacillota bacterium]|nr:DNA polymerase [Bacillota bacterium]